jgi:hypothetical protein
MRHPFLGPPRGAHANATASARATTTTTTVVVVVVVVGRRDRHGRRRGGARRVAAAASAIAAPVAAVVVVVATARPLGTDGRRAPAAVEAVVDAAFLVAIRTADIDIRRRGGGAMVGAGGARGAVAAIGPPAAGASPSSTPALRISDAVVVLRC